MNFHRTQFLNEETFIISDTHFNHKTILEFEPIRQSYLNQSGCATHDEMVKDLWNETVGPLDNVLHLGDFAWKGIAESMQGLNGDKYLILGNHDRRGKQTYQGNQHKGYGFKDVFHSVIMETNGREWELYQTDELFSGIIKEIMGYQILFSHYPIHSNDYDRKNQKIQPRVDKFYELFDENSCDFNIHGHTHSQQVPQGEAFVDGVVIGDCINASMEVIECKPIRLGELIERHIRVQKELKGV